MRHEPPDGTARDRPGSAGASMRLYHQQNSVGDVRQRTDLPHGQRPAQKHAAKGRWRRIVLGDVLAKHVVELRGRARACLALEVAGDKR